MEVEKLLVEVVADLRQWFWLWESVAQAHISVLPLLGQVQLHQVLLEGRKMSMKKWSQ